MDSNVKIYKLLMNYYVLIQGILKDVNGLDKKTLKILLSDKSILEELIYLD